MEDVEVGLKLNLEILSDIEILPSIITFLILLNVIKGDDKVLLKLIIEGNELTGRIVKELKVLFDRITPVAGSSLEL
jgi:hypothetical protein